VWGSQKQGFLLHKANMPGWPCCHGSCNRDFLGNQQRDHPCLITLGSHIDTDHNIIIPMRFRLGRHSVTDYKPKSARGQELTDIAQINKGWYSSSPCSAFITRTATDFIWSYWTEFRCIWFYFLHLIVFCWTKSYFTYLIEFYCIWLNLIISDFFHCILSYLI
jgi:hypothetical protein